MMVPLPLIRFSSGRLYALLTVAVVVSMYQLKTSLSSSTASSASILFYYDADEQDDHKMRAAAMSSSVPSFPATTTTTTGNISIQSTVALSASVAAAAAATAVEQLNRDGKNRSHNNPDKRSIETTPTTNNRGRHRAIFVISMGANAANTTLVERFVWSLRNIGNFTGWIILLTDAPTTRYHNLGTLTTPATTTASSSFEAGISKSSASASSSAAASIRVDTKEAGTNNTNNQNKIIIVHPERKHQRKKKFRARAMNAKRYKTYLLEYIEHDRRLEEIELIYYLDVDIIFGKTIQPFFDEYEQKYHILQQQQQQHSTISTTNNDTTNTNNTSYIYFFEGNGSQEIQGGQFILERRKKGKNKSVSSNYCLDRWRQFMYYNVTHRYLKDQMSLTMMLEEQRQRPHIQQHQGDDGRTMATTTTTNTTYNTKTAVDTLGADPKRGQHRRRLGQRTHQRRRGNKNKTPASASSSVSAAQHCEIVLMEQNTKYIQFPELEDIQNHSTTGRIEDDPNNTTQNNARSSSSSSSSSYATLVHIRNSANVMRDVDEEPLQLYIQDILRSGGYGENHATTSSQGSSSSISDNNTNNYSDPLGLFKNKMLL